MSAVAAAALAECGREAIRLDTGATVHGIRVPDASADAVRSLAELLARETGSTTENGMTVTPAAPENGRPACREAAAQLPDSEPPPLPQRRRPRRKKTEE